MLSSNSVCSALGTKPKVILSKVGAAVVAGESRFSVSVTTAVSSTVSSVVPPQATTTKDKMRSNIIDFYNNILP
jgi:hypothetical protein